ncbi:hypothetical protein HYS31_01010 [Candidatus Woesearchaeota archaeon]|nr:hypothetical protein [Candidatus Woesearchaeota archaeon]
MGYTPGKSLKACVSGLVNCDDIGRRDFFIGILEAAGIAAAGASLFALRESYNAAEKKNEHLDLVAEKISKNTNIHYESARKAVYAAEESNAPISITKDNRVNKLPDANDESALGAALGNTVIVKSTSPFMSFIYSQIPQEMANSITAHVDYVVFHNKVERAMPFLKQPIAGISVGEKTIIISTAESGGIMYSSPSVIAHEARHLEYESDCSRKKIQAYSLPSETIAALAERATLEEQIRLIEGQGQNERLLQAQEFLKSRFPGIGEKLQTAYYLGRAEFAGIFRDVYPQDVILSRDLLGTNPILQQADIEKIIGRIDANDPIGKELYYAAWATQIALGKNRDNSVRELYKFAANPHEDPFRIINALYALSFLAPDSMHIFEQLHTLRGVYLNVNATREDKGPYKDLISYPEWEQHRAAWVELERKINRLPKNKRPVMYTVLPPDLRKFHAAGKLPSLQAIIENKR